MPRKKPEAFCRVTQVGAGSAIRPCAHLARVLSDTEHGPGVRFQTFVKMDDMSVRNARLVLYPPRRIGKGMIANFCPYCGVALTEGANGYSRPTLQDALPLIDARLKTLAAEARETTPNNIIDHIRRGKVGELKALRETVRLGWQIAGMGAIAAKETTNDDPDEACGVTDPGGNPGGEGPEDGLGQA